MNILSTIISLIFIFWLLSLLINFHISTWFDLCACKRDIRRLERQIKDLRGVSQS